jgi:hypothetical protein
LQVFFKYQLRLANRGNSQLLVGHTRYSPMAPIKEESQIKAAFGFVPVLL